MHAGDMTWEVLSFLSRTLNISMHYIQRDANMVVDQLAKVAIEGLLGYLPLSQTPESTFFMRRNKILNGSHLRLVN